MTVQTHLISKFDSKRIFCKQLFTVSLIIHDFAGYNRRVRCRRNASKHRLKITVRLVNKLQIYEVNRFASLTYFSRLTFICERARLDSQKFLTVTQVSISYGLIRLGAPDGQNKLISVGFDHLEISTALSKLCWLFCFQTIVCSTISRF